MNVVGIVAALAAEARFLDSRIPGRKALASLDDGTLVAVSGVGPEAAARGARALVEAGATALTSWGMAGGLDPALTPGTLFLPAEVVSRDGTVLRTARYWRERLGAAVAAHCRVACGKLLTSPQAIESVADKASAFRETGAAAVDMESLAIGQIAMTHGLPFIAIRVIADSAEDAVPRAVIAAVNGSGRLQIARLISALAMAPADIVALVRLARRFRAASRSLVAVARTGSLAANAFPVVPDSGMS
jgi:adenosylhomocysteine nucleosidase